MSCQSNSNKVSSSGGAAAGSGISSFGSRAAYAGGVIGGAMMGGMVGNAIFPGPGTAAGLLIGGWAGARLTNRARQKKAGRRAEQTWQRSDKGIAAVTKRDRALSKAKANYAKEGAKLVARKTELTDQYKQARAHGMAAVSGTRGQGLRGLVTSPEAKAAGSAFMTGATKVAGALIVENQTRKPGNLPPGQRTHRAMGKAGRETLRQAGQMKGRVQTAREQAWLNTPEGRATNDQFQADMKAYQRKRSELARTYNLSRGKIEGKYALVRDKFLRQHQAV